MANGGHRNTTKKELRWTNLHKQGYSKSEKIGKPQISSGCAKGQKQNGQKQNEQKYVQGEERENAQSIEPRLASSPTRRALERSPTRIDEKSKKKRGGKNWLNLAQFCPLKISPFCIYIGSLAHFAYLFIRTGSSFYSVSY
ncbi:hypothetical protein POVCU2_0042870 [Plasmodium ovale curtisi]|uniref:Uncharacterized protein n=1 Tax=Plasmodium ovale curtisi TaxID=864141 RepID=A0A1A8W3X1_PLAOA|nr:hypothetical protein POVCU2_0042870 [Plasmodium ovale curtisi]SBS97620.1 hypothetical protein POVCU1_039570 [Plasmodium ovale curtisi]